MEWAHWSIGVGFYSAFMVADNIEVTSRRADRRGLGLEVRWAIRVHHRSGDRQPVACPPGEHPSSWRSNRMRASSSSATRSSDRPRYPDHILFPELELPGEAAQQINTASALWHRSKSEVKPEEYTQALRSLTNTIDEPALTIHYKAEGRQSYAVLLFVPKLRPYDLFDPDRKGRVKLYVRRVFITDDAGLLPAYLRFVRGVVDSEDLPLNISRDVAEEPDPLANQNAVTGRVLSVRILRLA